MIKRLMRRAASRFKRGFAQRGRAAQTAAAAVVPAVAADPAAKPDASEVHAARQIDADLSASLLRRIEILERSMAREIDRARLREGASILAGFARDRHIDAALEALRVALERRSSALAERVNILQRDWDTQRAFPAELEREILFEEWRSAQSIVGGGQPDVAELRNRFERASSDLGREIDAIATRLNGLAHAVDESNIGVRSHLAGLQAGYERLHRLSGELAGELADLIGRQRATPYMAQPVFAGAPRVAGDDASFDYVGFEAIFRGSPELVRDRQRAYLSFMWQGQRIIDLGCGRGEFLELARDAGTRARGVDMNREMVRVCERQNFDVHEADALTFLKAQSPASADLVFSAQFIEHLEPDVLHALLGAARRVLVPGGLFIAETVNPHSLEALKCFYVDLSHVKPLFPEVMLFFAHSAGYRDGRIFYPTGDGFDERRPWNCGEYALVATA